MKATVAVEKPTLKPARPMFSSGPCAKRPGWELDALRDAFVGRSFRGGEGQARLRAVIEKSRQVLGLPPDYRVAIVPGSDTGAFEMALWNLLGANAVDVCCWENFGLIWLGDIVEQLRIPNVTVHRAGRYGALPDLSKVNFDHDVVFPWNGTTSGVCVPGSDWIPAERRGLTICDATSAVFAMEIDYSRLDVVTWSWQKALGGEGAHGMIALSPAAVDRLLAFRPDRPLPKIFRLTRNGTLLDEVFDGFTINSPSIQTGKQAFDALDWCLEIGGGAELVRRSRRNLGVVARWVERNPHVAFLAEDARTVSSTSMCLRYDHEIFARLPVGGQTDFVDRVCVRISENGAGHDLRSHREAPPGLRIWGGPTVDAADLEKLLPWVDWAFGETVREVA